MESNLQIISGQYRGRRLYLPPSARPTQNRARMAIFNMLASLEVRPRVVWDAFAGSGILGIESLSRFPDSYAIFTDAAFESIATVQRNLRLLGITNKVITERTDAIASIPKYGPRADLIFVDPPYAVADMGFNFVGQMSVVVRAGTILVWEQDGANERDPNFAWEVLRDKRYGRARFLILRRKADEQKP